MSGKVPVFLTDGDCGFCARLADLARAVAPGVEVISSQSLGEDDLAALGVTRADCDRVGIFIDERGRVHHGAFAINAISRRVWWAAPIAVMLQATPLGIVAESVLYALVARNRRAIARVLGL